VAEIVAETARLVLRRERPGDREIWLAHVNTPEAMAHLGGPKPVQSVHEDFDRMAAPADFPWVLIARKADDVLLGKCGMGRITEQEAPAALTGKVQVGWTLRADCWRQGYGREAAAALLTLAIGRYGLGEIYAQTSQRNAASWRLMESLGMGRRPELDYHDPAYPPEENPTIIYSITSQAWSEA
jgi:RimJ/RimL family protein N-acetyltransferase